MLGLRRQAFRRGQIVRGLAKTVEVPGKGDHEKEGGKPRASFQLATSAAEARMQQAIKDGALDNLPGAGKRRKEDVTKG